MPRPRPCGRPRACRSPSCRGPRPSAPWPRRTAATAPTASTTCASATTARQVLDSTYVPVDEASWVDQGLTDRYRQQLDAGASTLQSALGAVPDRATQLVDGAASASSLDVAAAAGTTTAVVPTDLLAPGADRTAGPLTQTFDLITAGTARLRAVPADTDLSTRLASGDDQVLSTHEVLAELTLTALSTNGGQPCVLDPGQSGGCSRGLALLLPADATRAVAPLEALLTAMADRDGSGDGAEPGRPVVSPLTAANLLNVVNPASGSGATRSTAPVAERELNAPATTPLGSYPSKLDAVDTRLTGFRSMIPPDARSGVDLVTSLDQVLLCSGDAGLDDPGRLRYLSGADATIAAQTAQVTTPEQQVVTLTSGEGTIPLSISNALSYPVQVRLVLTSAKLEFPDGNEQVVDLPADTPTPVPVRVKVRASGAFPLEVTVRSPDRTLSIATTKFNVRSTSVSGLGLVLTITAGLFLLLWWARHFRRTRRARQLVGSTHPVLRGEEPLGGPTTETGTDGGPDG